jgi:Domain of unkown function (DUF1775)
MDFPLSVQVPDEGGKTLLFPTLQTYSDGKVVRWIAPDESADTPAPHLDVTAAAAEGHAAAPTSNTAKPAAAATTTTNDDAPSKGLVIVAIVLGALGLLVGIAALVTRRNATASVR